MAADSSRRSAGSKGQAGTACGYPQAPEAETHAIELERLLAAAEAALAAVRVQLAGPDHQHATM